MKYDIFVSYSRADIDIVRKLVDDIHTKSNARCWVDWNGVESGAQFVDVIISAIDKVDTVLFILSDNSMASEFARREIDYARIAGKKIIPVVVDGGKLRGWFLFFFGLVDYIDIKVPMQYDKLLRNIGDWYGVKVLLKEENMAEAAEAAGSSKNDRVVGKPFAFLKRNVFLAVVLCFFAVGLIWIVDNINVEEGTELIFVDYSATGSIGGHEYVDLGLPSSVKWATCNIGQTKMPEDYGKFYAWGEIAEKDNFSSTNSVTLGLDIDSISGNKEYDVAQQEWGSQWRMPSKEDFEELFENCIWQWSKRNGIHGSCVTSKINGKSIFLPAAGNFSGHDRRKKNENGYYWTSNSRDSICSYYLNIYPAKSFREINWFYRDKGLSIRPVFGGKSHATNEENSASAEEKAIAGDDMVQSVTSQEIEMDSARSK